MAYGMLWKGLSDAFGAVPTALDDYQKRMEIKKEQDQRQQGITQEGERVGLARQGLEQTQQQHEYARAADLAASLQVGIKPSQEQILQLRAAGIDLEPFMDPNSRVMIQPFQPAAEAQRYTLGKRQAATAEGQLGAERERNTSWDAASKRADRRGLMTEFGNAVNDYNQRRQAITGYGKDKINERAALETEWRHTVDLFRKFFKDTGMTDADLNEALPRVGGKAAVSFTAPPPPVR